MPPVSAAAALAEAAAVGPFFAIEVGSPPADDPTVPPWREFRELTDDAAVLADRIDTVRAAVADRGKLDVAAVPARPAASLTHLGVVARLVSPPLAAGLLGGVVPDLDAGRLLWRATVGGPVPLALADPVGTPVDRDDPAAVIAAMAAGLAGGPVARLTAAVAEVAGVSRAVLWGNVASAVAGALTMLVAALPDRAGLAAAVGGGLIERAPLTGTGRFTAREPGAPPAFVRSGCCLYYRVPGGGLCGDCVLAHRPAPTR